MRVLVFVLALALTGCVRVDDALTTAEDPNANATTDADASTDATNGDSVATLPPRAPSAPRAADRDRPHETAPEAPAPAGEMTRTDCLTMRIDAGSGTTYPHRELRAYATIENRCAGDVSIRDPGDCSQDGARASILVDGTPYSLGYGSSAAIAERACVGEAEAVTLASNMSRVIRWAWNGTIRHPADGCCPRIEPLPAGVYELRVETLGPEGVVVQSTEVTILDAPPNDPPMPPECVHLTARFEPNPVKPGQGAELTAYVHNVCEFEIQIQGADSCSTGAVVAGFEFESQTFSLPRAGPAVSFLICSAALPPPILIAANDTYALTFSWNGSIAQPDEGHCCQYEQLPPGQYNVSVRLIRPQIEPLSLTLHVRDPMA